MQFSDRFSLGVGILGVREEVHPDLSYYLYQDEVHGFYARSGLGYTPYYDEWISSASIGYERTLSFRLTGFVGLGYRDVDPELVGGVGYNF